MDAKKLKWIAMIAMLMDHLAAGMIRIAYKADPSYLEIYKVFRFVGRLAFPIFLFLMVEGVIHTGSILKYIRDLLIFAFISDIFFDRALFGRFFDPGHQNVYFTLFLCTLLTFVVVNICAVLPVSDMLRYDLILFFGGLAAWVAFLIKCDYRHGGVLAFFVMLIVKLAFKKNVNFRQVNFLTALFGCLVLYLYSKSEAGAFVAPILIYYYNGRRGNIKHKYFYYAFYPVHLALIALVRMGCGG